MDLIDEHDHFWAPAGFASIETRFEYGWRLEVDAFGVERVEWFDAEANSLQVVALTDCPTELLEAIDALEEEMASTAARHGW